MHLSMEGSVLDTAGLNLRISSAISHAEKRHPLNSFFVVLMV